MPLLSLDSVAPCLAQANPDAPRAMAGFWSILFSGGWIGVAIMLALIGLSVAAVYLVIDQFLALRRRDLIPPGLSEAVTQLINAGRVREAEVACRQYPSILSNVLAAGLIESEHGWGQIEKGAEEALHEASASLMRRIEYLNVIGNLAPMLGLLGTVTGMLFTFREVAATSGSANAADLADGIYQALVTTVVGLIIAIPSLGAFAILRNRVDLLIAEIASVTITTLTPLKRRVFRKATSAGTTASVPAPGLQVPPRS